MIPRLVVASKNRDKLVEVEAVLSQIGLADELVGGLEWADIEETGSTLEENALLKARSVVDAVGLPAVGDDTGLEVSALGGRPGVFTARYAGEGASYAENYLKLLGDLEGEGDRSARFRTAVALVFPDGAETLASGHLDGTITLEPRGTGGFGYDPVFEVDGKTLSEMGPEQKNLLSHRARAIRALGEKLGLNV